MFTRASAAWDARKVKFPTLHRVEEEDQDGCIDVSEISCVFNPQRFTTRLLSQVRASASIVEDLPVLPTFESNKRHTAVNQDKLSE